MRRFLPGLAAALLVLSPVAGAEPGLILRFGEADARLARQVALYLPEGQAASAFTAPGRVEATWEGTLNLEARSRLIFTLEGAGEAKLFIDEEPLCEKIGAPSERKRLSSGEHKLRVEYRGPEKGDTQLRLFWEGRDFGREPIPAGVFTHAADELLAKQGKRRRGHELIEQHNCASCHGREGGPDGPVLNEVGSRFQTGWLAHWILDPPLHRPSALMPKLFRGDDAMQKAADIAHFLVPPGGTRRRPLPTDAATAQRGGRLFYEQGCIGCHTLEGAGDTERIGLAAVGQKFQPWALAEFLSDPAKHHATTRMPEFGFDEAEGIALEVFLRSLDRSDPPPGPPGDRKRGEVLFKQSGCLNCHAAGDAKSELPPQKPFAELASADCRGPQFGFDKDERDAIAAALGSPAPHTVPSEFADRHFVSLRCAACHERDGQPAYREQFAAEVAHLKPADPPDEVKPGAHGAVIPRLDHLGLKLRPEWREALFRGEIEDKTRPWLHARMPSFAGRAVNLSAGFSHAVGLPSTEAGLPDADAGMIEKGAELAGVTGFACGACHAVGEVKAFAVFEGEGPNFQAAGERIRDEYFHLWMNDPPRLWPGTIMPKYATDGLTPLTQHYEGDATKQFEAIRQYLRSLSK